MKRKTAKLNRLRLSPNEEAQFVREELNRRRKLRVQQVREQERHIARQVRHEVQERKEKELQIIAATLGSEWQKQRTENVQTLEKLHDDSLRAVGQGYRNAKQNVPDWDALARETEEKRKRAKGRHQQALRDLVSQRQDEEKRRSWHIEARKNALIVEKKRAMKVASLPQPVPNPIESIGIQTPPTSSMTSSKSFSITYCHVPETTVDRETETEQSGAQQSAKLESHRLTELEKEKVCDRQEQLEKAQLRGSNAFQKEKNIQDNTRLLCELRRLQHVDLQQRRQTVNNVPAQIFQPLYRHDELRAEQQRELEIAFQDLYSAEKEVRGDLVPQPVPEPLSHPSPGANDEDLDVTLDPPCEEYVTTEATPYEEAVGGEEAAVPPTQPKVNYGQPALNRLLARIRRQREQWSYQECPAGKKNTPSPAQDKYDVLHKTDPTVSEESIEDVSATVCQLEEQFTEALRRVQEKVLAPVSDVQFQKLQNYQQSLLEQNRLKKKCAEHAHWQLEEKQKKLQLHDSAVTMMTQSQQPPASERTCLLPSVADRECSAATMSLLNSETDCPVLFNIQTGDSDQNYHTDLAPVSQLSLHTAGSALTTLPSSPYHSRTTCASMPCDVLNTSSSIFNFTPPLLYAPLKCPALGDRSLKLVPLSTLSKRRSRYGPSDVCESVLHHLYDVQHLPNCTGHTPPASATDLALASPQSSEVPPPVVPVYGQTFTRPGQEKVVQSYPCRIPQMDRNQCAQEEMMKQRNTMEALLKAEASSLTFMGTLLKAAEESKTQRLHCTSPSPPLESSGSSIRKKPPISRPPSTVQIVLQDLEPHELSTIQEVNTPASANQNTVPKHSPGPSTSLQVLMSHNSTHRDNRLSWREMLQLETANFHTGNCPIERQHLERVSVLASNSAATVTVL